MHSLLFFCTKCWVPNKKCLDKLEVSPNMHELQYIPFKFFSNVLTDERYILGVGTVTPKDIKNAGKFLCDTNSLIYACWWERVTIQSNKVVSAVQIKLTGGTGADLTWT